jgi:L-fucose isomerase-like protein
VDQYGQAGVSVDDVVIDETEEVGWRLKALAGLKNTLGRRVLCVGGASGWGAGGKKAPQIARELWKLDLVDFSISQLGERMKSAYADDKLVREARLAAGRYLASKQVKLEVPKESVERAFVLTHVFRELMRETGSTAMTVNRCMGPVMQVSETTACLPLSILNDEGYLAFCESDFVVIPSGILLNGIAGVPVFLNDPTYPHHGLVTLAHCTAPRRLDGKTEAPVRVLTHFESDFGAAPKVEMRVGEKVTNIVPDFDARKWVGFLGEVAGNPFMPICRSQVDVGLKCSDRRLAEEMRGFHWMMAYGDALKETGYAVRKLGVEWLDLSAKG